MANVRPMLRAFRRDDQELAGEWAIRDLELGDLQRLFDVRDEMYDSYPVRAAQVDALQGATGASLDLDRYDYFVDVDAV